VASHGFNLSVEFTIALTEPANAKGRQAAIWSGLVRHSVYFSILDSEWPSVKARLEETLAR
jgi:hypothetical protein